MAWSGKKRGGGAVRGARTLEDLQQKLKSGWPAGLTVLTGEDAYHLDRGQRALLQALVPGEATDFGLTLYGGEDKVDPGTVVASARSVGMFDPRRVVLVRDVAILQGEPDALVDYARKPPQSSHLIVRAPKLDRRRKLHQALAREGELLDFAVVDPQDAAAAGPEVARLGAIKGLDLDPRAAAFLAEVCAGDFYRIDNELEKVRTWLGDDARPRVGLDVVREVASGSGLLSGWEVADAVLLRDRGAALAAVRGLVQGGDEPIRMVGGLAWRARTMLQAKALLDAGMSPRDVVQRVRAFMYGKALIEGLGRYSSAELLRFPALLFEADLTLKSRALAPQAVLERLVEGMTAPGAEG